jgi:hypothetical protein
VSGSVSANDLVKLALTALQTAAARNAQQSFKTLARVALLQTVGALSVIAAFGCGLGALLVYATPILGAAGALLAGAGVFAAIALAALGLAWRAGKARARAPAIGTTGDATLAAAANLFKQHTGVALAAALLAGVFLGGER